MLRIQSVARVVPLIVSLLLPVHLEVVAPAEAFQAPGDEILDPPQVFLVGGLGA